DTNMTVTASVAINGHKLGSGLGSRRSGLADMTVVRSSSRSSTRSPWTTGSFSPQSHSGVRLSTAGICGKLYLGGGQVVAHSSDAAPQGLELACRPLAKDMTRLITNKSTAVATISEPMLDSRLGSSRPIPAG